MGMNSNLHVLILSAISYTIDIVMLYLFAGQEVSYEMSFNQGNHCTMGSLRAADSGVVQGKSNIWHNHDWQDVVYFE